MIKVNENQLKLPLYPEWNEENQEKTNEIPSVSQKYMSSNTLIYTQNGNIHIKNGNDSNVFPITGNDNSIIQTYIDNILSICSSIPSILQR